MYSEGENVEWNDEGSEVEEEKEGFQTLCGDAITKLFVASLDC
jgi:hypothetical protein